jgi:hypothetical protein
MSRGKSRSGMPRAPRGAPGAAPRPAAPARERSGPRPEPLALPGAGAWALAAWAALLLLAPPASNWFWGVNGFRSLWGEAQALLVCVAGACAGLPFLRPRSRAVALAVAAALALALALVIAFPLREATHWLGDTQVRLRAMAIFSARMISVTLTEWSTRLHANPLDIVVDFLGPIGLHALGLPLGRAVSMVSCLLAMVFFAGTWRVAGRLGAPPEARLALCAALAFGGVLEVFAGYAESAGLLLATAAWWWAEMLSPLDRPAQAARTALAWLVMLLGHRLALVMLVPLAWRVLGPPLAGDRPEVRRRLAILVGIAAAIGGVSMLAGAGGRQLGMDLADVARAVAGAWRAIPPSDYLNTLALVAPLAVLAPWLAGREAITGFLGAPVGRLLLSAAIPLLPLMWIIPANVSGLGAQRDWDLAVLGGLTLTLAAGALLGRLPSGRLRGALLLGLPLLALQSGAWLAVNADAQATARRARALVEQPPGLAESHLSQLHGYLGQRAMDVREPLLAAPEFERSFALNRNPRRAFLAAEAWALGGDLPAARSALARGRAAAPLSPTLQESARQLDALIARMAADSAAAAADTSARR